MPTFTPLPARAAFCALALAATSAFAAAPQYHLVPIDIPGAASVYVADMNDDGMAVGYYIDPKVGDKPFVWTGTEAVPLPIPADREDGHATAINNLGQIAGYTSHYTDDGAVSTALVWNAADIANYTVIETPVGSNANPDGINDLGTVVGLLSTDGQFNAFEWTEEGGLVDDGVPAHGPGTQAFWSDINNLGQKVGGWFFPNEPAHATIGQSGVPGIQAIAAGVDATSSKAHAINEAGVAVGEFDFGNDGSIAPVTFANGVATEVPGALFGLSTGIAFGINEAGTIVGRAYSFATLTFKAFVHIDGVSYDIAEQSDNGDAYDYLLNAVAVNESGAIAGTARGPDFSVVSFIAQPVVGDAEIFADEFENATALPNQ